MPTITAPHAGSVPTPPSWGRLVRPERISIVFVGLVIAWLGVVPLGYLVWRAFFREGAPTTAFFERAYSEYGLGTMLANSLWFAAGATMLAVTVGTLLAYLVVRTDIPAKTFLFAASLAPLVLPGVLYTVSWIFLASPRSGALNEALAHVGIGPISIFGVWGMVLVEGLHLAPLVFLLMFAAFRSIDTSLEETALVAGARLTTVFRRVTLRLVAPALSAAVLIVAVRSIEAFEVPALLGIPGGVWVFTSRIWRSLSGYPLQLGEAAAYALPLLVLTSLGLLLHGRLGRRAPRFQSITGKGFRSKPISLGAWRWPALCFGVAYVVVAVVLPVLILVYASTQRFYAPPSIDGFSSMTLDNYREVLGDGKTIHAFQNSLILGAGTATAVMLFMALAAWVLTRTRVPGRGLIDALAFLPIAVPGIVLGVALLFVYLRLPLGVYGTLWILFIAYCTRFMPYGMRYASVSMAQVGRELEESARASGATWWQTFRRVLFPLALPGLIAGWTTILILSLRELSSSILLYSPGKEVLSIRIWEQYQSGKLALVAALGILMTALLTILSVIAYKVGTRAGLRAV
ncbi:MAG: ABC transporter permease [Gaiellaceae bacterium]